MKQSIIYSAALLLLAGCTADTLMKGEADGRVPIGVSVTGAGDDTRAGTHIQKSQFDVGETFTVYFASGSDTEHAQFTTTNSVGATEAAVGSAQPCFLESSTEAVMHAYYPQAVNNLITSFTVETDQTDTVGFKHSDLMYATATATKSGKKVTAPLQFEHKMAKIVAMVTAGDSVQSIYSVRIVGGYRTISITDGTTCTLGNTYSDPNSTSDYITMYDKPEGSKEVICAAMLPPQDINEDFLEIVTDNGTYLSALTKVLEGSHTYNLAVVVGAVKKTSGGTIVSPDGGDLSYDSEEITSEVLSITIPPYNLTYDGTPQQPDGVTVQDISDPTNPKALTENTDYQLAYVNNVNAGTAMVVAVGLGSQYSGQAVSATFTINKQVASIWYETTSIEKSVIDNGFTNPLSNSGDGDVRYSSSNTSVATVNRMGKVTIVGAGTATITATASDGANYTYTEKKATYTVTVGKLTLDALKRWVNDQNTAPHYYGYYVSTDGEVHADYKTGDIGRVAYYATADVDSEVSGSRILVLALTDVGMYVWGGSGTTRNINSESGYNNTKRLQAYGSTLHPAAYAAWNYYVAQPDGASRWFLPSIHQWTDMMVTAQMSGTGTISYGTYFWSSVESTAANAWSVTAAGSTITRPKSNIYAVRPCFAY
jgi:uncharacterized protein YjdB